MIIMDSVPNEPTMSVALRRKLANTMMVGIRVRTFSTPVISMARRELVLDVNPRKEKMMGA